MAKFFPASCVIPLTHCWTLSESRTSHPLDSENSRPILESVLLAHPPGTKLASPDRPTTATLPTTSPVRENIATSESIPQMHFFKNILVYQAADQLASASLRIAVHLARQNSCDVKVVDVRNDLDEWWNEIYEDHPLSSQDESTDQQDRLNALVDEADFPDDVRVKVLAGRPIEVLVNELNTDRHDLLLKDADSESANLFFGSLDMRLIHMSPVPLWIANPTAPPKSRRILAAIDPHVSTDGTLMNQRVIHAASMLAQQEDAELFVVSGWFTTVVSCEDDSAETERNMKLLRNVKRRAWENVEHAINQSLRKIPADNVIFERKSGVNAIVSAAIDVQPDLLVMGSIVHTGIPGLLIGNTAEEVTRQISCSLLTLKPDNFRTID